MNRKLWCRPLIAFLMLFVLVFVTTAISAAQPAPPDGQPLDVLVDPAPGQDWEPHTETITINRKTVDSAAREAVIRRATSQSADYVELDTLIVIYPHTAAGHLEAQHVDRVQEQVRQTAVFLWRNSHLKLHLNLTFVVIDAYKDASEFTGYSSSCGWIWPNDRDGDGESVENDLLGLGFSENQFDSINLLWAHNGPSTIDPCAGGLSPLDGWYWDELGHTGLTTNALFLFDDVWNPFHHEFQHTIDGIFGLAGNPAYFHADYPQYTSGRFGVDKNFHAVKMREWPIADWLQILSVWGNYREAPDVDEDGVPDDAPDLYITEATLGSLVGNPDSDADNFDDRQEAMGGLFRPSDPLNEDTDGDGLIDGHDPEPIYDLRQAIDYQSQTLGSPVDSWASLMDEITDSMTPFNGSLAASWDEDFLYLMIQSDRIVEVVVTLDAAGDGYFHGYDYQFVLKPHLTEPLQLVHIQDCSPGYLDTYGSCRFDDHADYPGERLIEETDIESYATDTGAGYMVQMAIPGNPALDLALSQDHEIGLSIRFQNIENDWAKKAWLFEKDDLVFFPLNPPPHVCVSPNRELDVSGFAADRGDILCYDGIETWRMLFDASDLGINTSSDMHAFTYLDDGSLLMTFDVETTLPGLAEPVTPWDVVHFYPSLLGEETAGAFEICPLDGAGQLAENGEKIDALHYADNTLYVSTIGNYFIDQGPTFSLSGGKEDILLFTPDGTLCQEAGGYWEWILSDNVYVIEGLAGENIQSLWLDADEQPYVSMSNDFVVMGVSGIQKDILQLLRDESGDFVGADLYWSGPDQAYNAAVDGLHIGEISGPETSSITVCVETQPDGQGNFNYIGDLGDFTLGESSSTCHTFENLVSGGYQIQQNPTWAWYLQVSDYHGGGCSTVAGPESPWTYLDESVTVNLAIGSAVECVFVNYHDPYESNDILADAHFIEYGAMLQAAIGDHHEVPFHDDVDFFKFEGQTGDRVVVQIDAGGTNLYPDLYLADAAGTVVAYGDSDWGYAHLDHILAAGGEYFLAVDGSCMIGGSGCDGAYYLSLGDAYEPNDDIAGATPISYGDWLAAVIGEHDDVAWYEDTDFYSFNGEAGDMVRASLALPPSSSRDLDPYLCLLDGAGSELLCNDPDWSHAVISHELTSDGLHYLRVSGVCHEGGEGCDGPYWLGLYLDGIVDEFEPNDTLQTAAPIGMNSTVIATLSDHDEVPFYDDLDHYAFDGSEGALVSVNIKALGGDLEPRCELLTGSGSTVASDGGYDETCNLEVNLPIDDTYTIKIFAYCDGFGGYCSGPYSLTLAEVGSGYTQDININAGWNLVSSCVAADDASLAAILAPIVDDIVLVKNGAGEVYWPEYGVNDIGNWDVRQGYQIYMTNGATLSVTGTLVDPAAAPIDLPAGWNMTAYLRDSTLAIEPALASIDGQLYLAKNEAGEIYWPVFQIDQIGDMQPGDGYQIYMSSAGTLVYPQ